MFMIQPFAMTDRSFANEITVECDEVTIQFFDIEDPLSKLKSLIEQLWETKLTDSTIWLQDSQQLDESKNLIEHGIEGEGKVQIKLQLIIKNGQRMINIVDVLKPDDDDLLKNDSVVVNEPLEIEYVHWIESKEFSEEKALCGVPPNLEDWKVTDVQLWIKWAIQTFNLQNINLNDWKITGKSVKQITAKEYEKLVPNDPNGTFWTHLQILQECGQVAVSLNHEETEETFSDMPKGSCSRICWKDNLWRFLLELLTDKTYKNIIRWVSDDGEFQLVLPEAVAKLWGEKKKKKNMTYDKFSRALRYYYEDKLSKVSGKKYVYKFHADVKELIGYSPMELNKLLNE